MTNTIYWHDYETFGVDPRRDRAAQFAGVRTDEDLNILGEPMQLYCQPALDFLPHPVSCLITGISPRIAHAAGLPEFEFIRRILAEFARPHTCGAGYNSLRFDDELTRQLLYRNFYDPYEREWKNGNSRWDIIDMVRLCAALRPEGINWPRKDDDTISFRLEELTAANGIGHEQAHDAVSDVLATIAMAKLVRERQPKLYDYVYQLRDKSKVQAQLDILSKKPVLHVSSMYPARHGCLALAAPLTRHPTDKNGVIMYDLRVDPAEWMSLSVEQIQQRLFTRQEELAPAQARIPVKVLHINRCPIVAPATLLDASVAQRYEIDTVKATQYWQLLVDNPQAVAKLASAFDDAVGKTGKGEQTDPDFMIYSGGFFSAADKHAMARIRAANPDELAAWQVPFQDARLADLLFRYRARNFPDSLTVQEQASWQQYCAEALLRSKQQEGAGVPLSEFTAEIERLRAELVGTEDLTHAEAMLEQLEGYAAEVCATAGVQAL